MNTKELSTKLNQTKNRFNTKHKSLISKYDYIGDAEVKAKQLKEDRSQINNSTYAELLNLRDEIAPIERDLLKSLEKKRLGFQSDREQQIQSAITFIQSNPDPRKLQRAIYQSLQSERYGFCGYLLAQYDMGLYTPMQTKGFESDLDVIEKVKALYYEMSGVNDIKDDIAELDKIGNRINNFINITSNDKHNFMFFADAKMTAEEINQALKYLDDNPQIPIEQRIGLKKHIAEANPGYVNDYSNMQRI